MEEIEQKQAENQPILSKLIDTKTYEFYGRMKKVGDSFALNVPKGVRDVGKFTLEDDLIITITRINQKT